MHNKPYKYLLILLAAVLAAACAELPEESAGSDRYITVDLTEIDTKVSNEDITDHEFFVWVYDEEHDDKDNPLFKGTLKYDDDRWKFHDGASFQDVEWGTGKHTFLIRNNPEFYSDEAGTGQQVTPSDVGFLDSGNETFSLGSINLTYPSEESKKNYYNDLVCAAATRDISNGDYSPVNLELKHMFASLQFNIINNTGQKKTISDFNINSLRISGSASTIYFNGNDFYTSLNAATADNKYSAGPFELEDGASCTVFSKPAIVWPYDWGTYSSNAPNLSITVDGKLTTKNFYTDLLTQKWESGKLYSYDIKLTTATDPVIISPNLVKIEHIKENDILTHSAVTLDLSNMSIDDLNKVYDLKVTVKKGGETYLSHDFATLSTNVITISRDDENDKYYLPQGDDYQVLLSYNDGLGQQNITLPASGYYSSPAPEFTVTVDVWAASTSLTINSMYVNISDNVLNECPIQGHPNQKHMILKVVGQNSSNQFIYTDSDGSNSSILASSTSLSNWGPYNGSYYQIVPYVEFDGVLKSNGSDLKVITLNKTIADSPNKVCPGRQTYTLSSALTNAQNMVDGALYVIRPETNYTTYYWYATSGNKLSLSTSGNSGNDFYKESVFVFEKDDSYANESGVIATNYLYKTSGALKSVHTGKYLDHEFNISDISPEDYFIFANCWRENNTTYSGSDIDIYKSGGNQHTMYFDTPTTFGWTTDHGSKNGYRKWYIYPATAQ